MKVTLVLTLNDDSQVYDGLYDAIEALPMVESIDFIGPDALIETDDPEPPAAA